MKLNEIEMNWARGRAKYMPCVIRNAADNH